METPSGVCDGKNARSTTSYIKLVIGRFFTTVISNVSFANVDIAIANGKNVGAVIGYVPKLNASYEGHAISSVGTVSLSNIIVDGSVSGSSHVGGIVGKVYSSAGITFTDCTNHATVLAVGARAGGCVATMQNMASSSFDGCVNTGAVTASDYAAGLVAYSNGPVNVSFTDCSNSGYITCNSGVSVAGGLAGTAGTTSSSVIFDNCSNAGVIHGARKAGGLIGTTGNTTNWTAITLRNAISNTGSVYGGENAGGILCAKASSGNGNLYSNLTIDSSAEFTVTGTVMTEGNGVKGTYWVFQVNTSWYYCNENTKNGTLAE